MFSDVAVARGCGEPPQKFNKATGHIARRDAHRATTNGPNRFDKSRPCRNALFVGKDRR